MEDETKWVYFTHARTYKTLFPPTFVGKEGIIKLLTVTSEIMEWEGMTEALRMKVKIFSLGYGVLVKDSRVRHDTL